MATFEVYRTARTAKRCDEYLGCHRGIQPGDRYLRASATPHDDMVNQGPRWWTLNICREHMRPEPPETNGETEMSELSSAAIAGMSEWLDESLSHLTWAHQAWARTGKVGEEAGEVVAALIGYLAENPRKGRTHSVDDVIAELLDVAVTALGAVEHFTANSGTSLALLDQKILAVAVRAGVITRPAVSS